MADLPQEIIRIKRDRGELTPEQIKRFITAVADNSVTDAQIAAFSMAVLLNGMTPAERTALTLAMAHSGERLDWSDLALDGPVLGKHSSGGIGDKVSLVLGPIIAACGGYAPKLSGRGLGHTGGTVDKLEAIPGYNTAPEREMFRKVVAEVGCATIGQTGHLAPADKRIYAVRDTTATVESIDLLAASMISKKLAEGLDGLVMDIKFGSGAFMPRFEDAQAMAEMMCAMANDAGLPTTIVMSDMNQCLGRSAGNALEVREAIDLLAGRDADPRLDGVVRAVAADMLLAGGLVASLADGEAKVRQAIASGAALEKFSAMTAALGGPADLVDRPEYYMPPAPVMREVRVDAPAGTKLQAIDTRALGLAIVAMGGGRTRPDATIDHAVGLTEVAAPGDVVGQGGRALAIVHAASEADAEAAAATIRKACALGMEDVAERPLIARRITAGDVAQKAA